ncbi:MAG: hypothetical protein IPF81_10950 [Bacteroidetes bacterium]|nr:hypothetical protein [Bacteroidota bacterium]
MTTPTRLDKCYPSSNLLTDRSANQFDCCGIRCPAKKHGRQGMKNTNGIELMKVWKTLHFLKAIEEGRLPSGYGQKIDDRIVEYPWIFAQLKILVKNSGCRINI